MAEIRYIRAINQAMSDAMAADSRVVVFGEDVAAAGGAFSATRDLLGRFGPARVIDMPISESTIASAAVGAAMSGLRPIFEIMFMDFSTLSMDALVNQAAKAHFMFGGQTSIPLVMRTPHGAGLSAGPQHSQCLEAWFAHVPGLKVVCPADVNDAYSMLRMAIEDPDPVIFIENKALYARKGDMAEPPEVVKLGTSRLVRPGRDATIVAYGMAVHTSVEAAATLSKEGIEVEVIDLRSLQPWDEASILASLARTHRLVIVHEAVEAFGIGAEIAARMADVGFDELDAPIVRVGAPFMPVPFSQSMERQYLPSADKVVAAVRRTLA